MKIIFTSAALFFFINVLSSQAQPITPPYSDDFEGVNAGWTASSISGSNWQLGLPTTPPLNTAHSGTQAWDVELNSNYAPNTECYLVSPEFDFSSIQDATLKFWQNRQTETGWDGTRVDYSVNNGTTWTVLGLVNDPLGLNWYNAGGLGTTGLSGWDGTSAGWEQSTYDLSILNGLPSVRLRFSFASDATTNLAGFSMDDFEITIPVLWDAGTKAILEPNAASPSGTVNPMTVVVSNDGLNYLTSMNISWSLNAVVQGNYAWTGLLAPGSTDTVTVGSLTIPAGSYQVCANTVLAGDGNASNDSLCESLTAAGGGLTLAVTDSLGYINCASQPQRDKFYIAGQAPALNNGDTVNLEMLFGDGSDSSWVVTVSGQAFYSEITHDYPFPGLFSVQVNATAAGGLSGSVTGYNILYMADSCGNITGQVYLDQNNNCVYDGLDYFLPSVPVRLKQGANVLDTYYTDLGGNYYFAVPDAQPYDLEISTNYPGNNTYCPASGVISNVVQPSAGNNFAWAPDGAFDLEPALQFPGISSGSVSTLLVSARNNFFLTLSGAVKLQYDTSLFSLVSTSPAVSVQVADTLIWNGVIVGSPYTFSTFNATVLLAPKPALISGTNACFTVMALPGTGDSVPANNSKNVCGTASASVPEMVKSVDPAGTGPGGNVSPSVSSFTYTVTFQNTGVMPVFNAFILDTIDSSLDPGTLLVTGSSHLVNTGFVASDVVRFSFDNILLPDAVSDPAGSHAFVSYSIAPKPGLPDGTVITNSAVVYLDFYAGASTNSTVNTIDYSLGVANPEVSQDLSVYPVPASGTVTVSSHELNGRCVVYDLLGNEKYSGMMVAGRVILETAGFSPGIYVVRVITDQRSLSGRMVIAE